MQIQIGEEKVEVELEQIEISRLKPNLAQPRRYEIGLKYSSSTDPKDIEHSTRFSQLVKSILENKGIVSPLIVETADNRTYMVVDGDRRLGACNYILNDAKTLEVCPDAKDFLSRLPCLVLKKKLSDEQRLRLLAYIHVHQVAWGLSGKEKVVMDLLEKKPDDSVAAIMGLSINSMKKSRQIDMLTIRINRGKASKSYAKELLGIRRQLLDKEVLELTIKKINEDKIKSPVDLRLLRDILPDNDAKKKYMEPDSTIDVAYNLLLVKNAFPSTPDVNLEELMKRFDGVLNSINWTQVSEYKNNPSFKEVLEKCINTLNRLKSFI